MGKSKRVMFLTEDADHQFFLEDILNRWGYEVWTVQDWTEAQGIVLGWDPSVIFMDGHTMQGCGDALLKELKRSPWTKGIAVIGYALTDDLRLMTLNAGIDGWLAWPVKIGDFRVLVTKHASLAL